MELFLQEDSPYEQFPSYGRHYDLYEQLRILDIKDISKIQFFKENFEENEKNFFFQKTKCVIVVTHWAQPFLAFSTIFLLFSYAFWISFNTIKLKDELKKRKKHLRNIQYIPEKDEDEIKEKKNILMKENIIKFIDENDVEEMKYENLYNADESNKNIANIYLVDYSMKELNRTSMCESLSSDIKLRNSIDDINRTIKHEHRNNKLDATIFNTASIECNNLDNYKCEYKNNNRNNGALNNILNYEKTKGYMCNNDNYNIQNYINNDKINNDLFHKQIATSEHGCNLNYE